MPDILQTNCQGPPAVEPPIELLSSLCISIQVSISRYKNTNTPEEKAVALKSIQASSSKLTRVTTSLNEQWLGLSQRPQVNVTIRIALEMGLFDAIPSSGDFITAAETAKKIDAQEEFIFRLARVLGAWELLEVSYSSSGILSYSHTPLSRLFIVPGAKAAFTNQFDLLLPAQMSAVPGYYQKYGFKSHEDSNNCPFTFAHGAQNTDFFNILHQKPEQLAVFNNGMEFLTLLELRRDLHPFDQLEPNTDGIALVDIGGGKGQILQLINETYPNMKGKLVLEDLKPVLEGGVLLGKEVALQPYDFFKQIQPVKGSTYFFKSIFHDWPDEACIKILINLAPAMRGYLHSRVLISDLILADQYSEPARVIRDINIMLLGGKERSLSQWRDMLGRAGFKILKVYGMGDANSSIIEAVLDEQRQPLLSIKL